MNGWQRLGILITTLYVIAVSGYGLYDYQEARSIIPELRATTFFVDYERITEEQRKHIIERRNQRYKSCLNDDSAEDKVFCTAIFLFEPNFAKRPNVIGIIFLTFIIPVLFWAISWASISVVRWIVNGFNDA